MGNKATARQYNSTLQQKYAAINNSTMGKQSNNQTKKLEPHSNKQQHINKLQPITASTYSVMRNKTICSVYEAQSNTKSTIN
jgi:hypothetical protein